MSESINDPGRPVSADDYVLNGEQRYADREAYHADDDADDDDADDDQGDFETEPVDHNTDARPL